jgi:hypothetical protein
MSIPSTSALHALLLQENEFLVNVPLESQRSEARLFAVVRKKYKTRVASRMWRLPLRSLFDT